MNRREHKFILAFLVQKIQKKFLNRFALLAEYTDRVEFKDGLLNNRVPLEEFFSCVLQHKLTKIDLEGWCSEVHPNFQHSV